MASKTQLATAGEQQAAVVINNSFIDGLTKQLEEKCKYGLSFPKDYNLSNALMGAYLVLKETKDRNNKPVLESCTSTSIANSLMNMATLGLSVQKNRVILSLTAVNASSRGRISEISQSPEDME